MKKVALAALCMLPTLAFADGYKVATKDGARSLTYYAGKSIYTRLDKQMKCSLESSIKGIDQQGNAFNSDGFSCTKDLYVVIKVWIDTGMRAIIEVDPKTEKRDVFQVDSYKPY